MLTSNNTSSLTKNYDDDDYDYDRDITDRSLFSPGPTPYYDQPSIHGDLREPGAGVLLVVATSGLTAPNCFLGGRPWRAVATTILISLALLLTVQTASNPLVVIVVSTSCRIHTQVFLIELSKCNYEN